MVSCTKKEHGVFPREGEGEIFIADSCCARGKPRLIPPPRRRQGEWEPSGGAGNSRHRTQNIFSKEIKDRGEGGKGGYGAAAGCESA